MDNDRSIDPETGKKKGNPLFCKGNKLAVGRGRPSRKIVAAEYITEEEKTAFVRGMYEAAKTYDNPTAMKYIWETCTTGAKTFIQQTLTQADLDKASDDILEDWSDHRVLNSDATVGMELLRIKKDIIDSAKHEKVQDVIYDLTGEVISE